MRRRTLLCLGTAVVVLAAGCSSSSNVTVTPATNGTGSGGSGSSGGSSGSGSSGGQPGTTGATSGTDAPAVTPVDWQDCPTSKDYDNEGWDCATVEELPVRAFADEIQQIEIEIVALAAHRSVPGLIVKLRHIQAIHVAKRMLVAGI